MLKREVRGPRPLPPRSPQSPVLEAASQLIFIIPFPMVAVWYFALAGQVPQVCSEAHSILQAHPNHACSEGDWLSTGRQPVKRAFSALNPSSVCSYPESIQVKIRNL